MWLSRKNEEKDEDEVRYILEEVEEKEEVEVEEVEEDHKDLYKNESWVLYLK